MALLSLLMAVFLGSLDQSIANTALPAIGAALQRTPAESVWVIHAYQLAVVALLLPVSTLEKLGLVAVLLLVLIVELLNSAIEAVVDRVSLDRHPLSKNAKDLGSAAVLLACILALATWGAIVAPLIL
jgi:diacylglycerol kinase